MPYRTKTQLNYKNYRTMCMAIIFRVRKSFKIILIVLECLYLLLGIFWWLWVYPRTHSLHMVGFFVMCAVVFPLIMYLVTHQTIKKAYQTNQVMHDQTMEFCFYEDHFTADTSFSSATLRYDELYRVVETKDFFYLMIADNQTFIVTKEACEPELISLLQKIRSGLPKK